MHKCIRYISITIALSVVTVLTPSRSDSAPNDSTNDSQDDAQTILNDVEPIIDSIEAEFNTDEIDTEAPEDTGGPSLTEQLLEQVDWSRFDLPIPLNESVIYWVEHFSNSGRWSASKWIRASGKYRNLIHAELKKAGLPKDLLYMAMIESGFDPTATSHAEAVGVWQFIPSTGKQYGLIINDIIDERRDPVRSTQAAIAYLSKLNKEFGGNWHLAMASYNAGEARIYKAISQKGTINYWDLRDALAEETQFYVPKILALAILDKYPELFGVPQTSKKDTPLVVKHVSAKKNQHVTTLADMAEMDVEEFLKYNPHILKERLIVEEDDIRIYVPPEQAETYIKNSRSNEQDRLSSGRQLSVEEQQKIGMEQREIDVSHHRKAFEHTVADGDTWKSIAQKHTLSVTDLKRWNPKITTEEPTAGDTLRLTKPKAKKYVQYTVKSSDTLKSIAKKYDCSVEDIRAWNGLDEDAKISKGDVLFLKE